jgi:hypothetical protein
MGRLFGGARLFSLGLLISVAATLMLRRFFGQTPPANFTDFYLLGLLFVSYYRSWKLSMALLAVSAILSAFLLRPLDWIDGFQIVSYAIIASVVIWAMAQLKRPGVGRRRPLPAKEVSSSPASAFPVPHKAHRAGQ